MLLLPLFQPGHIDADQPRLHHELFLNETEVGSKSPGLFAEPLNGPWHLRYEGRRQRAEGTPSAMRDERCGRMTTGPKSLPVPFPFMER